MLISLIIPIYNEQPGLAQLWQTLAEILNNCEQKFEVILVDDGSTDKSWQSITALTHTDSDAVRVYGLRLSRNFGKEAAILAGLHQASGNAAIVMDADLQHPPSMIPQMLSIWDNGKVEIVEAVKRRRQNESLLHRFSAKLYYRTFNLSSGLNIGDSSDFKLLDRRVVDQYIALPEVGRYFRGLTAWLGFHAVAMEFDPPQRQIGRSRWSIGKLLDLARSSIISFSSLPLRSLTWLGGLGVLFSIGFTLQTLWYKWQGFAEEGFPTVILLILGMGSMTLLGLGLIGEYIAEIYWEVKHRPSYIISQSIAPSCSSNQEESDSHDQIKSGHST
ncbi:MAG: glycosyltransferase family 2 protein [Candidatus Thiodiazotropha sp. (ex Epidulcina cf. delphinae)]|nr:glycosyltransferase family 2 protein [Candidatus Thiodiazotropha sp. (ex Epidulcina cf. delphinae)]